MLRGAFTRAELEFLHKQSRFEKALAQTGDSLKELQSLVKLGSDLLAAHEKEQRRNQTGGK